MIGYKDVKIYTAKGSGTLLAKAKAEMKGITVIEGGSEKAERSKAKLTVVQVNGPVMTAQEVPEDVRDLPDPPDDEGDAA